jgi:hypothetical protein
MLLLLGAWIGHGYACVVPLNCLYGHPLPRHFLRGSRFAVAVLILGFPAVVAWGDAWLLDEWAQRAWTTGTHGLALGYLCLCWLLGLLVFPAITIGRLLYRAPRAVVAETTTTVDVAAMLGYAPHGQGKHAALARLPANGIYTVDFTQATWAVPDVPAAWDGLTILHLSDLHLCGTPDRSYYEFVFDRALGWGVPDLLVITGDIVDSQQHHHWVRPLLGRLKWREAGLAILGNHDTWHEPKLIRRRLEQARLRVLANEWTALTVRGEPLIAIGHEGPWVQPAPDLRAAPPGFRLLLSHTPDNLPWARRHRIPLMLSGHNHGGQIRFSLIGSVFVPSRFSRRYDAGTWQSGPTLLHVNRGLAGREPIRYGCHPQVTHITLRRPSAS